MKDSGTGVDANNEPQDAGPDADETGTATVITHAVLAGGTAGQAVGNIDIVSMLPNNTVLETTTTDAGGMATIKVYPGGTVTAIYKHTVDMGADLITYVDVKPNDTLTFGSRSIPFTGTNTSVTQSYTYPSQAGVTTYQVITPCTSGSVAAPTLSISNLQEFDSCRRDPMDALWLAFTNNVLSHFSFRTNITVQSGATHNGFGWQAVGTGTANISGLPDDVTNVSGSWTAVLNDSREATIGSYNGQLTGGTLIANFPMAATGRRRLASLFISRPNFESMRLVDVLTGSGSTQTIAAPALPPFIQRSGGGGPFGSSSVLVSPALGMATWFLVPTANSSSDGGLLRLNWSHVIDNMGHPHQWHFILPPGKSSIVFPKLPSTFAQHVPGASDQIFTAQVRQYEISTVDGYDAARALPSADLMCIECALRAGDFQRVIFTGN